MVQTKPVRPVQLKNTSHPLSAGRPLSDYIAAAGCLLGVTKVTLVTEGSFCFLSPSRRFVKTFQAAETRQRTSEHRVPSTRRQKLKHTQTRLWQTQSVFPLSRGCLYVVYVVFVFNLNICRHFSNVPNLKTPYLFIYYLLSTHPDDTTLKSFFVFFYSNPVRKISGA